MPQGLGRRYAAQPSRREIEASASNPENNGRCFRKFVRGEAAKRAGIKGTGVGLSIVPHIVDACGGEIRLESAVGIGSTFTILLPLVDDENDHEQNPDCGR
jgi:signal transduction histidine kinase